MESTYAEESEMSNPQVPQNGCETSDKAPNFSYPFLWKWANSTDLRDAPQHYY